MTRCNKICSDEELKEISNQWCDLVDEKPTDTTINAFVMGAKLAISNDGWTKQNMMDSKIKRRIKYLNQSIEDIRKETQDKKRLSVGHILKSAEVIKFEQQMIRTLKSLNQTQQDENRN